MAVFVLARSRLPLYLLPLFVPMALLGARALEHAGLPRRIRALLTLWVAGLVALRAFLAWVPAEADDRRLAAALAPLAAASDAAELVFVDDKARCGLAFYLGREVERVCLEASCRSRTRFGGDEPLAVELWHDPVPQLYLYRPRLRKALQAELAHAGFALEPLGHVGRWEAARVAPRRESASG